MVQEKRNIGLLNLTTTSVSLHDTTAPTPQSSLTYKRGLCEGLLCFGKSICFGSCVQSRRTPSCSQPSCACLHLMLEAEGCAQTLGEKDDCVLTEMLRAKFKNSFMWPEGGLCEGTGVKVSGAKNIPGTRARSLQIPLDKYSSATSDSKRNNRKCLSDLRFWTVVLRESGLSSPEAHLFPMSSWLFFVNKTQDSVSILENVKENLL